MNIQIPFDLLGNYESIVLNTDDTFYDEPSVVYKRIQETLGEVKKNDRHS